MDESFQNSEAQVFLDDMHYMEDGTAGLWPIDGVVEARGWNYEKKDYVNWGFITIDTDDGDEDEDEEDW